MNVDSRTFYTLFWNPLQRMCAWSSKSESFILRTDFLLDCGEATTQHIVEGRYVLFRASHGSRIRPLWILSKHANRCGNLIIHLCFFFPIPTPSHSSGVDYENKHCLLPSSLMILNHDTIFYSISYSFGAFVSVFKSFWAHHILLRSCFLTSTWRVSDGYYFECKNLKKFSLLPVIGQDHILFLSRDLQLMLVIVVVFGQAPALSIYFLRLGSFCESPNSLLLS